MLCLIIPATLVMSGCARLEAEGTVGQHLCGDRVDVLLGVVRVLLPAGSNLE